MSNADELLKVEVVDGRLVISIGVDALAFACDHCEFNNPFVEAEDEHDESDFKQLYKVVDPEVFAQEVVRALKREKEDGTTPVHELLDHAFADAIDDGAEGIEEVK